MPKNIPILILSLLIAGCGYHLRGSSGEHKVEIDNIYLEGASGPLNSEFKKIIKFSSSKLAPSPDKANIVIKVIDDKLRTRILSYNQSGVANEMELDYQIYFEMDKAGKTLSSGDSVKIRREYFNNQFDIIAKNNENKVITNEIYRQAAYTLIDRARIALAAATK